MLVYCTQFLVTKLARLCPAHRPAMILEFKGRIQRLLLHREASRVLADIYELYANAYERALLVRDLYGRETALFSSMGASCSEEDKEQTRIGLKGVLKGLDAEKKKRVLVAVKENLDSMCVRTCEQSSRAHWPTDSTTLTKAPFGMQSSTARFRSISPQ
jgi:pumilio family protein 6